MRSFLAALALLLAGVVGTASLTAYVAHRTVLDPHHSGRLLSSALEQPELRHRLLVEAVPGYETLPLSVRAGVDQVAQTPQFISATKRLRVDAQGRVHLTPFRRQLQRELRANGLPQLAAELQDAGGPSTFRLPASIADQYSTARDRTWLVATRGAIAAVLLLVIALLVSRNRRATTAAAGFTVLASCVAAAALWWFAPAVVDLVASKAWGDTMREARTTFADNVISALLPVAGAGVALMVFSFVVPRGRRS
jgi:hypothetical protein